MKRDGGMKMSSKNMLEQLKAFVVSDNLLSVYDMDVYTTQELLYKLAQIVNEMLKEVGRFEGDVLDALKQMADELDELLHGDKVKNEIFSILLKWKEDGTLDHIIKSSVFLEFETRLTEAHNQIEIIQAKDIAQDNEIANIRTTIQQEVDTINEQLNDVSKSVDDLEVEINENLKRAFLDVNSLGAKGDGKTDDTDKLQEAINLASRKNYELILNGVYLITKPLQMKSNVHMRGIGKTKIITSGTWTEPVINIEGTLTGSTKITSEAGVGSTTIGVQNTTGISNNSYHILKSQRSAFSDDAGLHFRLGTATGVTDDCYLGEFIHVSSVNGSNLTLSSALMFPDYKPNAQSETGDTHRSYSTIEKLTPIENVKISNIEIVGGFADSTPLLKTNYAVNVVIKDCLFTIETDGAAVFFTNSYKVKADSCSVVYKSNQTPTQYYYRNGFKMGSSQDVSIINCHADGISGQPFDITYIPQSIPSSMCRIVGCFSNGSIQTGITLHPGTFACVVKDCQIRAQKDGITLRGQNHQCVDNILMNVNVDGTASNNAYGISAAEGYGNNLIISGNKIDRFPRGFRINEANSTRDLSYNKQIRLSIVNNKISNYCTGILIDRPATSTTDVVEFNALISNNVFSNINWHTPANSFVLYITGGAAKTAKGIILSNNLYNFDSSTQPTAFIRCDVNTELVFSNNIMNGLKQTSSMFWFYGSPTRSLKVVFENNLCDNKEISFASGSTAHKSLIKRSSNYVNSNNVVFE